MKKITQVLMVAGVVAVAGLFFAAHPLTAQAGVCSGGNCVYQYCRSNADCGTTQWTGAPTCQGNDIWQNFTSATCFNPGTSSSYCVKNSTPRYQASCAGGQTCQSGKCVSPYSGST